MIIKSMARKAPTFGQLIAYIGRERDGSPDLAHEQVFAHNLYHGGVNRNWVEAQFVENYHKLAARQNGNALYHEILALEPQPHLTTDEVSECLQEIARCWCNTRAPGHLVCQDTDFPHVHLMISSNAVNSGKRTRLSRKQFAEAQRKTEKFAKSRFADLDLIPVYNRAEPSQRIRKPRSEGEMERRTGQPSRKEEVAACVRNLLVETRSLKELSSKLEGHSLFLYQQGSTWSVEDLISGKRYRLRTLGLAEEHSRWQLRVQHQEHSTVEVPETPVHEDLEPTRQDTPN